MRGILAMAGICFVLWSALAPAAAAPLAQDATAAVILAYSRIGEDEYPETSIRREQFESHIRELVAGRYNVISLPAVVDALRRGESLPPHTVALTFDGGHRSVLDNAVPLLKKYGLPFTIFIATEHAAHPSSEYLGWSDLRDIRRDRLATIGLHPDLYTRLYDRPDEEIARRINNARTAFRDQMGTEPDLFAYPFGEYSQSYRDIVEKQGFAAAFGQHSGAAFAGSDLYTLPRFTMTESYGGLDRFSLTADALPLPVSDIEPRDPVLSGPRPSIGFTVDPALKDRIAALSCFVSGQGRPGIEILSGSRIELRLAKDFDQDRIRINCTLPAVPEDNADNPRWRWFGMLLVGTRRTQGDG